MTLRILSTCYFYILLGLCPVQDFYAQTILVDEDSTDWSDHVPLATDPQGDHQGHDIDFKALWLTNDDQYLYFRLDFYEKLHMEEANQLRLYIDCDNDAGTGDQNNLPGADLIYHFGDRYGQLIVDGASYSITQDDIELTILPSVSSAFFELTISRDISYDLSTYAVGDTIRVLGVVGDENLEFIPDTGSSDFPLTNHSLSIPPIHISPIQMADFRLMSWNVLFDGIFEADRQDAFRRIIQEVEPDVLAFQEIYDHSSSETALLVDEMLPGGSWYHGRVSPDIHLISRFPIVDFINSDGNGIFHLNVHDKDVLVVNAHLPCCQNDQQRQMEIDRLLSHIRQIKAGLSSIQIADHSPIIVTGDMNLVSSDAPKWSLINGDIENEQLFGADVDPDWDGSPFVDAKSLATYTPKAITWIDPLSSFASGRLDYLLYTQSVLDLINSYTFYSKAAVEADTTGLNVRPGDSEKASDHLPVVGDFDMTMFNQVTSDEAKSRVKIFPNPASHFFIIEHNSSIISSIELWNDSGQKFSPSFTIDKSIPSRMTVDISGYENGLYMIRIVKGEESLFHKIIRLD